MEEQCHSTQHRTLGIRYLMWDKLTNCIALSLGVYIGISPLWWKDPCE